MTQSDDRDLLEFGRGLTRYASFGAPPVVRARLRASLLAAPVTFAAPRPAAMRWTWLPALRPAIAALAVLALLVGGAASAAASSLPGDPAFGLKRAAEEVQVALTANDTARLNVLVAQSGRRLVDLETTAARRPSGLVAATDEYLAAVARVDATLTRLATEPRAPARDTAIASAALASADHLARLEALAASLPSAAQHGIQRAIEVQLTVHGKAGEAPGRRGGSPLLPVDGSPVLPTVPSLPALPVAPPGRGSPAIGLPGRP